jgi:hypothetical protein
MEFGHGFRKVAQFNGHEELLLAVRRVIVLLSPTKLSISQLLN